MGEKVGAAPEVLAVAATVLTLGHYGQGRYDVLIGVRTMRMPEILPLRIRISNRSDIRAFLDEVATRIAGVEDHPVPLGWLLDHYPALAARRPLYDVAVEFSDSRVQVPPAAVVARVTATSIDFHRGEQSAMAGTASRFPDHVGVVLTALSADDRVPVGDISPLTADERAEILVRRNKTATVYRRDSTIHELVDEQARARPDAVAVSFDGARVTYGELLMRANRLAHQIAVAGAGPGEPVGVCVPRDADMVVAKLAVLKIGAAYVPLDPDEPDSRLESFLRLGGVRIAVVSATTAARLGPLVTTVDMSRRDEWPEAYAPPRGTATDPAMVLFTSGSTGEPKAVELTHRAITRIADNPLWLSIRDTDVVSQSSHSAFDWCAYQIWATLINGASLVIVPRRRLLSPRGLSALVRTERINTLCLTTALFHELAGRSPTMFAGMDRLLIAGERLRGTELRRVLEQGPPRHVYNLYGPTENGVFTTFHECSMSDVDTVPIGRPVPNTTVYILDHRRSPVADGVVGDLYVGGDGLSPGYRGRPDLTDARFVPNPFDSDADRTLFDTGDRASYRPDGVIEFHGRRDFQIKIRGFRIEPEEVESQLARCPNVRQAAVIPSPDSGTNRHLIAFIVPTDPGEIEVHEIRHRLRKRLQPAAVPGRFVVVEELPLNARGKVDRTRLTELADTSPTGAAPPGQDDIETAVTALWRDVLQIPDVEPDDDFFSIGGDSRLVTQLVHRVNALFATEIEPVVLFESPTIAGFAEVIRGLRSSAPQSGDNAAPSTQAPLSWPQEALWDTCALASGTPLYNEAFTLTIREALDTDALVEALNGLTRRHPALRTGFIETGGRTVQQVADVSALPLTRTDLSAIPAEEQNSQGDLLGAHQARLPFALDRPPLARAQLIRFAPDHYQLHLVAHHLVSDGISFSHALVPDLYALYRRRIGRATSVPPPVSADYLDHAREEREQVTAASCAPELRRVADELHGARPTELPLLQTRPPISSFRGARRTCQLPPGALEGLKNLSRQHGVTPALALFSIFQIALYFVTEETDLVTGLAQDTRSRQELDGVCGTFVNTTPLRCDLSGDPTYSDLLARTHRAYVAGQALRGTPLPLVEQHLAGELPVPLFRIAFSVQPGSQTLGPSWSVRFNTLDNGTSRFDLTLFADIEETTLGLVFEYATDIVSEGVVARLDNLVRATIDAIAARPEVRLSELARARSVKAGGTASSETLQAATEAWTRQLGAMPPSADSDFFDAGGNSVRASRLIATARHRFGIDIAHTSALTRMFLNESTVNGLAKGLTVLLGDHGEKLSGQAGPSAHIDFTAESTLPADVEFPSPSPTPRHEPEWILLTGANGFLGSSLLKEALTQTDATIYCFVRAKSRQDAEGRIKAGLRDYGAMAMDEVDFDRIVAMPGDLAAPRLGLAEADYDELARKVDTILHNGAWVNFIYPYETLKGPNVDGTTRVLRLAAAGRPKRLHYISSQGVFSSQGFFGVTQVDESTRPANPHHLLMGYVESKWVAEALLRQARERGLDVSVYRPHDIGGHSKTGDWKTNGFVCSLIRSFVEIGAIPDYRLPLDLTPVDITARAVVDLALRPQSAGSVFHLNNPRYAVVGDLEEQLNDAGHPVRTVSARDWDGLLLRHTREHPDSVIAPFAHLFTERWTDQNLSVVDLYLEDRMPRIECSATWNSVTDSGIACPPGRRLLPLYTEYLDRIGFLGPRRS
ncbi:amino acid adenylation domain-containing protein [Actinomadura sp. 9N215]|uniref:amino acid adenylation domain-containing protein n=1 Tax=Actinomadura sp. 9N215 TaxID=3375150 RepID=UPI0037AAC511